MNQVTKQRLIYGGIGLVVLSAIGYGVYKYIDKKSFKTKSTKQKEKELKKLFGVPVNFSTEGYVNVRSSPKVDNKGFMDYKTNLIAKVSSNPIGTVLDRVKGKDGYFWYKIELRKPVRGITEGYVREDVVDIKS